MSEPTIDEQLAARRALRDAATVRMIEHPCPDACGHDHLTPEKITAWGLWWALRRTGRMGEHQKAALALEAQHKPLPEPEQPARPPREGEVPTAAWAIYRLADENGWYGGFTYSRGPKTDSRSGRFLRMVDVITLRLGRHVPPLDLQRLVVAWVDGSFESATAWGAGSPATVLGSPALKAHLQHDPAERKAS